MSRDGSVIFPWGDGDDRRFNLSIGPLRDLQEKTGVSPYALLERLMARRPMVDDAREVLRFGLIGAGVDPAEAARLVKRWCDGPEPPHAESINPAIVVLSAGLYGAPDEAPGKSPGAAEEPTVSPPMVD